jgi:hypothetical protein
MHPISLSVCGHAAPAEHSACLLLQPQLRPLMMLMLQLPLQLLLLLLLLLCCRRRT